MKLYISDSDDEFVKEFEKFNTTNSMEEASDVLILPGGLGNFYDLFRAIDMNKNVIVYNKDLFFAPVIKNLYEAHICGKIDDAPSSYMSIESDLDLIIKKLEER